MGPAVGRQVPEDGRHVAAARSLGAGGDDDRTRQNGLRAGRPSDRQAQQVGADGRDIDDRRVVLDRQVEHPAVPDQVVHPSRAGDTKQRLPAIGAVLRLVPGAEGQRRHAQVDIGQMLRGPQHLHARKAHPGAFATGRIGIVDADIADAFAPQAEGERQPVLAAADNGAIEYLAGRCAGQRLDPVNRGKGHAGKLVADLFFQRGEADRCSHGRDSGNGLGYRPFCKMRTNPPAARNRRSPPRGDAALLVK